MTTRKPDDAVAAAKETFAAELPQDVHQKISLILETMPNNMRPAGENKHFDYDYWSLDQISGYFRNRFGELHLMLNVDVEDVRVDHYEYTNSRGKQAHSFLTTLKVLFTIIDADTGHQVSGHGVGQGDDPGDKGANKAMSGALKYWLLKEFMVGGDDSEADQRTDRRSAAMREGSDVKITDSNIEGIARGGRSNKTSTIQVRQIRELARDLNWNAAGTAKRIGEWLNDEIELPEEAEEQRDALVRYLEGLDADDAGTVITKMLEIKDAPDEPDDDRSAPYA